MKVLITGANGFVGKNLTQFLTKKQIEIAVLIRKEHDSLSFQYSGIEIYHHKSDFESINGALQKARPDIIIHLASYYVYDHSIADLDLLLDANIRFGSYILEAMRLNGIKKIINIGTSFEHFNDSSYNPVNLYAATKFAFQKIITFYVNSGFVVSITLKLFDTYGSNDKRMKLLSLLKNNLGSDNSIDLSPGLQVIDLIHIEDLCLSIYRAIELIEFYPDTKERVFGISSGERLTLRQLVAFIEEVSQKKLKINWGSRNYREREVMVPWQNFEALPGWKASIPLKLGLEQFIKGT